MRNLPTRLVISYWLLVIGILFGLFLFPPSALALEKFGPHLACSNSPQFIEAVRIKHGEAGWTSVNWIPATVMVRVVDHPDVLKSILEASIKDLGNAPKFWPIVRIDGASHGSRITREEIDFLIVALNQNSSLASQFPEGIYLEFGNEVNWEGEWKPSVDAANYKEMLDYFASKAPPPFKAMNAAMNITAATGGGYLEAIDFWNQDPKSVIPKLSALAFNSYHFIATPDNNIDNSTCEGRAHPDQRNTILSWQWEASKIGGEGKTKLLMEFGCNPNVEPVLRREFVQKQYQAFLNGANPALGGVKAITPLLCVDGGCRVIDTTVFSLNGEVTWLNSFGGGTCVGGPGTGEIETVSFTEIRTDTKTIGADYSREPNLTPGAEPIDNVPNKELELKVSMNKNQAKWPLIDFFEKRLAQYLDSSLPQALRRQPQVNTFKSQTFTPVCHKSSAEVKVVPTGDIKRDLPVSYTNYLYDTDQAAALNVPKRNERLDKQLAQEPEIKDSIGNKDVENCDIEGGNELASEQRLAPGQEIVKSKNLLERIADWLGDIACRIFGCSDSFSATVVFRNFTPGLDKLKTNTISLDSGFWNAYRPNQLPLFKDTHSVSENEVLFEESPPKVENKKIGENFLAGVLNAQKTITCGSLPESLKENCDDYLAGRPPGAKPPGVEPPPDVIPPTYCQCLTDTSGVKKCEGEGCRSGLADNRCLEDSDCLPYLWYTIDYRNRGIRVAEAEKQDVIERALRYWPNSKIKEKWDYVETESIRNNWNPAFVIALWLEESGASGHPDFRWDLGCQYGKTGQEMPERDLESQLPCLFSKSYALPGKGNFEQFMCKYGPGKDAPCTFETHPNFPRNLKAWYDRLIPAGKEGAAEPR